MTELEASWLAGVMDCDGYFGLCKHKRGDRSYLLAIDFSNTNRTIAEKVAKLWDGAPPYMGKINHPRRKQLYRAGITNRKRALPVLKEIYRFMVIKRRQVEILIEFCKMPTFGRMVVKKGEIKMPEEILTKQTTMYREMRKLNGMSQFVVAFIRESLCKNNCCFMISV